jgi:hypothetical protein
MANMDQFLINNLDNSSQTFSKMAGYASTDYSTYESYFFLRRELVDATNEATFRVAQRNQKIRHCKAYGGRWLDYTVRKEFNTLAEWVADAGDTMDNVLYGVNRVHKKDYIASRNSGRVVPQTAKYVTLKHVLDYLGYVAPLSVEIPEYNAFDLFGDILKELELTNGPIPPQGQKCLVQKPDSTIVVGNVIDQKYYTLEGTESLICINVPQQSEYDIKTYASLSDMPPGTKVYFRTKDGHFHSTQDLMSED